ncbi:MAG: peptide deformylase [Acetobacterales bacterium]
MTVRDIIIAPDPRLKVRSAPVTEIDDSLRGLTEDMLETMYAAPGIGLAAPQIGIHRRIVVIDAAKDEQAPREPLRLINPHVLWNSDERAVAEEGCLSVPGHYADVERPKAVRVKYLDIEGAGREIEAEGLLARCLLHEIDHLDGILFLDHLSALKRNMILRKMRKGRRDDRPGERRSA